MSRRLALLPLLFLLLVPRPSRADIQDEFKTGMYFSVGPLLSLAMLGKKGDSGFGLEATLNHFYTSERFPGAVGLFTQVQATGEGSAQFSGGVQANIFLVGLELGVTHETGTEKYLPTTGLHVAPYVSVGLASIALRFGIPLSDKIADRDDRIRHPTEMAFVLTAKWPLIRGGR